MKIKIFHLCLIKIFVLNIFGIPRIQTNQKKIIGFNIIINKIYNNSNNDMKKYFLERFLREYNKSNDEFYEYKVKKNDTSQIIKDPIIQKNFEDMKKFIPIGKNIDTTKKNDNNILDFNDGLIKFLTNNNIFFLKEFLNKKTIKNDKLEYQGSIYCGKEYILLISKNTNFVWQIKPTLTNNQWFNNKFTISLNSNFIMEFLFKKIYLNLGFNVNIFIFSYSNNNLSLGLPYVFDNQNHKINGIEIISIGILIGFRLKGYRNLRILYNRSTNYNIDQTNRLMGKFIGINLGKDRKTKVVNHNISTNINI